MWEALESLRPPKQLQETVGAALGEDGLGNNYRGYIIYELYRECRDNG